ncbi:hypothetical protein GCM10009425_36520 [Pseudomonas asuensis]|uniref:Uncharacterized protein n=2 Tax=Pseudomonas asuensis TaxID=1825787 RepID=A0ABQ2H011_9PSED|nr:hypothetical protein GCM10009425_36520 [Pseudomonas asuensis]
MAKSLINSDLIERLQVDGYAYRSCKEVEWMMCDTVEGWPVQQRYAEIKRIRDWLSLYLMQRKACFYHL